MTQLLKHIALVSETDRIAPTDLMPVAAALQKQTSRDLAPLWEISATVDAFARIEDVPLDYWPIIIRDNIGYDALGIHLDDNGQPFALVLAQDDRDQWSLTCSHEAMEMLVDPFGNRMVAGDSPKTGQGRVNFLVEVCDPSEAAEFAYSINGVLVSDFYTPHFFDPVTTPGTRYSYTGAVEAPRTIRDGGYLTWVDLATGIWWQQRWFGTPNPTFENLGKMSGKASLRSQIDRGTSRDTATAIAKARGVALLAGMPAAAAENGATGRAAMLHAQIAGMAAAN